MRPARKVLIVDDDEDICEEIAEVLRDEGYAVRSAHDGHRGLELILREPWHAIVLDLKIPGLSGLQILKKIKEAAVPFKVIVASGKPMQEILESESPVFGQTRDEEASELLALADAFLSKPFDIRELLRLLSQ